MLIYKGFSPISHRRTKKKWHPRLIKMGNVVDTQMIGETIAERSSLTADDVHNVIRNLMAVMREQLLNSRTVKLKDWAHFYYGVPVTLQGGDVPMLVRYKSRDCVASLLGNIRADASKGNITRALIQGASYIHVNQLTKALGAGGGGNTGGSGDDKPGGGGQEAPDPAA